MTLAEALRAAAILTIVCAVASAVEPVADQSAVHVRLRAEATVSRPLVTVGDVAEVTGGTSSERHAVAQLDLAEVPAAGGPRTISARQIALRLLLAGYSANKVHVDGAPEVRVHNQAGPRPADPRLEDAIHRALVDQLAKQLGLPAQRIRVRFLQALELPAWPAEQVAATEVQFLADSRMELGRSRPQVVLVTAEKISAPVTLSIEAMALVSVPVAAVPVARGEEIQQPHIQVAARWIDDPMQRVEASHLIGMMASRSIRVGEVILPSMVREKEPEDQPYLVDPKRPVRLVAQRGALTVLVHSAQVLQRGRLGETVRVRNPSSGKVLSGRVVGEDEIHVQF